MTMLTTRFPTTTEFIVPLEDPAEEVNIPVAPIYIRLKLAKTYCLRQAIWVFASIGLFLILYFGNFLHL